MDLRHRVAVRDYQLEDIDLFADYMYRSPPGFLEAMGMDINKLPPEEKLREGQAMAIQSGRKSAQLTITLDGAAVGSHAINEIKEGESAIFHAHIFDPKNRGKGISVYSYPLACEIFMERFSLKEILFKTPKQNIGPNRIKEKLGIPKIGEELVSLPLTVKDLPTFVYKLDQALLAKILERQRSL